MLFFPVYTSSESRRVASRPRRPHQSENAPACQPSTLSKCFCWRLSFSSGLTYISYPLSPNSLPCHTSENLPVSPTIATLPKTHVPNPRVFPPSEAPRGVHPLSFSFEFSRVRPRSGLLFWLFPQSGFTYFAL